MSRPTINVQSITEALHALAAAIVDLRPGAPRPISPEVLTCRLLDDRHILGRIQIMPRARGGVPETEPSILYTAGILVGIRPGAPGRNGQNPDRGLVIAMGNEQRVVAVPVNEKIQVTPR